MEQSQAKEPILIIGAGPVGLCLAWRLARAGRDVAIFETAPAVTRQLRASTFHPPSLDLLEDDGITARLIANGRVTPSWQIRIHDTAESVEFDLSVLADDTGHPYRLQCHQAVLSAALVERLAALGVTVQFGREAVKVSQTESGVRVEFADGSTEFGAYAVGCEGSRSMTRDAIGASFDGTPYPEITVLATTEFDFSAILANLAGVSYIWKPGGTFSLLHLPDCWRCSFQAKPGQDTSTAAQDSALRAHLLELFPNHAHAINIMETRAYRVHRRLASRWRNHRLFIAGDAAHLNSPKGGMGLNGGLHDAFALADALIDGRGTALARYERCRKPVVGEDIIAQADSNRARMALVDDASRRAELARLSSIADDPIKLREFLLASSMIAGLRRSQAID